MSLISNPGAIIKAYAIMLKAINRFFFREISTKSTLKKLTELCKQKIEEFVFCC